MLYPCLFRSLHRLGRKMLLAIAIALSLLAGAAIGGTEAAQQSRVSPLDAGADCSITSESGWTTPRPAPLDPAVAPTSPRQKGSRLMFISGALGDDDKGEVYFWDGMRIVDRLGRPGNDQGLLYGSDPFQPGPAVRPFRRWAHVAPRADGADIGAIGPVYGPTPTTRHGYSDWWLFARGEVFDLSEDLKSSSTYLPLPAFRNAISLAVSGGGPATHPQVVGAYGSLCKPRPRFVNPVSAFVYRTDTDRTPLFRNVMYLSLHFDGRNHGGLKKKNIGLFLLGQPAAAEGLLFEDVWFDAAGIATGLQSNAGVTIRRSLVTDIFATDGKEHMQGMYLGGGPDSVFRIEESFLLRNGFRGDPGLFPWPPTGDQIWNIYNRNIYWDGNTRSMASGLFDSVSMMGASGDQFRPGVRVERNFFYQGYVMMGAGGGRTDGQSPSGTFVDNVLQRFTASGTKDDRGHPGWGIEVSWGANDVTISGNIVTGAQHEPRAPALVFKPYDLCPFRLATRRNLVQGNILDSGSALSAVSTVDGVSYSTPCESPWQYPGVDANVIKENILINDNHREHADLPRPAALGKVSNTVVQSNKMFVSRDAAARALGWRAPNRTLRSFMTDLGYRVDSSDGFPEYFSQVVQMRRGAWKTELTSASLLHYFRAGFGMPEVKTRD